MKHPANSLALLALAFLLPGCTTTEEIADSWRGHPIEEVVWQWGPPGHRSIVDPDFGSSRYIEPDTEQEVTEGSNTYQWSRTHYEYTPGRFESYYERCGDDYKLRTRYVAASRRVWTYWFNFTTNSEGVIIAGTSSYAHKLFPFNRISDCRGGVGSLRRE